MNNISKKLPDFIQSKINFHIHDLIEFNKNGKHLVLGKRPSSKDIVMQSNDYLCLANNSTIKHQMVDSIMRMDDSILMSAIYLQDENSKPSIEQRLSEFTNFDSCLLSQSGWNANVGLLQAICSPDTNVYIDFFTHMSVWEGARYANAKVHPFMHNNMKHLRKLIKRHGPGIIAVDSIYSTLGTITPLKELVEIAKEFGCATVIDESHSLGIYGKHGAGLIEELNLSREVDFMTASLAKSFAYRAGAIWANNNVNQCIPFVSYPAIFSSALLPYDIDTLSAILDLISESDDRRHRLFYLSDKLRKGLIQLGIKIRSQSQIISIETGDEGNTELVRDILENNGIFGAVFCRPATPKNSNLIRFSLNSSMTDSDIDKILSVCHLLVQNDEVFFK
ncbi:alpha-hydroxyketone-type quorum-sensing autoinducer synthase [Vibrio spartinae]|uniref:CAI-1 autoinducer synthase n=1 Tax=Vibrio spartinae TaxID=1918945 RepID=A0A1N6LZG4_9VIBR|nr:alpha-hydroxyketone-type quorum-sensing autoinducer synthase [Vibrio spartinae]QMV16410.1 CAI-1 autoinducer synthase [Vibrio spartinae]SIO92531.1 CAI-1 autoinducer synthase [Vibrio spartinae]